MPTQETREAVEPLMDFYYMPLNWKLVTIGEIALEVGSGVTPKGGEQSYQQSGIALIRSQNVLMNELSLRNVAFISPETHQSMIRSAITAGDVLLNITGASIGRVAVAPDVLKIANVNQHVCKIRLRPMAFPHFISYFLSSAKGQSQILGSQFGTTRQGLNYGNVRAFRVPLPPLPEQRAIARILQTAQNAIQVRRKELELERERKAALMQHLFTRGTRGEATKQTEVGEIPESWLITKFAEAVNIANGQVDPTEEPYRMMKHIGPENITPETGILLETKTNEQLNIISGNYYFTSEDVLYSKIRPYLNKVALPWFEGTCSADMYPLRPDENYFTREFLYHLMLSEKTKNQAIAFQARTGIPKINREQLGSISLLRPSLLEQKEISMILSAVNAKIAALEKEIALHEELFRALLEELMSGRLSALPLVE